MRATIFQAVGLNAIAPRDRKRDVFDTSMYGAIASMVRGGRKQAVLALYSARRVQNTRER